MKTKNLLFVFAITSVSIQAKNDNNLAQHLLHNGIDFPLTVGEISSKKSDSINLLSEPIVSTLIDETFNNYTDNGWTIYNVAGNQQWSIIMPFGNPAPAAMMNGFGGVNEDWLISKNIDLRSGYDAASFSFQTDASFPGLPMEVYITTDDYTNGASPTSVTWTRLNAVLDSDLTGYHGFVPSGNVDLTTYLGETIRIAFKYTNLSATTATSWEIDNFKVVATENLSDENVSSSKMQFYPNPVKETLNFSEEISRVKINDISGKLVSEMAMKGRSINLSKLAKGNYTVVVTLRSGETISRKIIKD